MSEAGTSAPGREPDTRHWMLEAAGVAVLVAAVHILCRLSASFLVGALNDDGVYEVLGKAIARGEGYRSIHLAAAPVQVRYPPGFPLLLAIPWALGGSLDAVRATVAVANVLATSAAAGLVWWIGRRDLGVGPWPLAVCAVSAFVLDGTIQYFNIPLTEPYFVLGWAAALVLARPLFDPGGPGTWSVTRAAGVGLVLAATTLFRTAAVGLLPAMLVALALHRRWLAVAACGVGGVLPMVTWATLRASWVARGPVSSVPDDLGYWRWLGVDGPFALAGLAGRTIFTNAVEYVPKLASYLFSSQPVGIGIVGLASVAVAVACAKLWREHTALVATTLSASALTLLWPYAQGRLLLPLLPFLGLLAADTVGAGGRHLPRRVAWGATAALVLTALAGGKTLLFLVDGLYGSDNAITAVLRFRSFGTNWTASVSASQDPVAIDSVVVDILRNEPLMASNITGQGVDNYLHEGAQAGSPPSGTFYDPGVTGTRLTTLGVHEHWNNATNRLYSRNLRRSEGIELLPQGGPGGDPDGDGMNNTTEYQAGTDPMNTNSTPFRFTAITRQSNDVLIRWTTQGGTSNRLQVASDIASGSSSKNFTNLSPAVVPPGNYLASTNYRHIGGAQIVGSPIAPSNWHLGYVA